MVSVIVPTYNRPEMLGECLNSIRNQTYSNLEVLVVNDGGQEVKEIVSNFNENGNVRYLSHSTNRGLAAARNSGIRAAKGKYVAYLDDDDVYYPHHIEILVEYLESSHHRVAYTDAIRAVQKKGAGGYVTIMRDVPYSIDFDADRMLIMNYIPVLCVMHDVCCLDATGLFDESLPCHEDWDLWIRMSRIFEFGHIGKTTCEFRWRHDATTMTSQRREDFLRTLEIIYERYRDFTAQNHSILNRQRMFLRKLRIIIHLCKLLDKVEEVSGIHLPYLRKRIF